MNDFSLIETNIIYEDNHLLAVNKPCGILSQPDGSSSSDLFNLTKNYIRIKYSKPGEAYLGLIHRLDRNVSGITLFSKTSKAAGRLASSFRERDVRKYYLAITDGIPKKDDDILSDNIKKDEDRRIAVPAGKDEGQNASLSYKIKQIINSGALLEIELHTGRFHQIRYQLSSRGWPVRGDVKYGSKNKFKGECIALHAYKLILMHPVKKTELKLTCPLPEAWTKYLE